MSVWGGFHPPDDEHPVIKAGDTEVSPHLHPPEHKGETTMKAFRGHLLLAMAAAALCSAQQAGISDALLLSYLGSRRSNRLEPPMVEVAHHVVSLRRQN